MEKEPPAAFVRVRADRLDALLEGTIDLLLAQAGVVSTLAPRSEPGARRALLSCQSKLRALYGEIVELRLVPFETVAARLVESVEDLASSLGKKVRFEILGRDVRLDRSLLDALVDPLLHVMRNALDHGVESPRERKANGKQPEGLLALELERRGEEIRISVRDDGRGLDPERLRQAAVRGGFLSAADAARLGSNEALELIVVPGLSTAPSPSQVSGRGVGMDVLRGALERLGGKLSVESEIGKGTTIGIRLPLAIAVVKTLLVRCRDRTLAIPISTVERLGRLEEPPPSGNEGSPRIVRLADRLGLPPADGASHEASLAVLCATPKGTVSLLVDEALGRHDALVKPLRSPLSLLPEYSGAALLDDGSVALVLDPSSL